jgi:2-haloacid dehalogenase
MMVAAHSDDLAAAAKCGLRTGFLPRPDEHGPGRGEAAPAQAVDFLFGLSGLSGQTERPAQP